MEIPVSRHQKSLEAANGVHHVRKKITGEFVPRYRKADKAGKTKILNEYLALVGGNRKCAIFKLSREGKQQLRLIDGRYVTVAFSSGNRRKRVYARYYDDAVKTVLIKLWGFFRCICGERLTPLIKTNLDALGRRKRFGITREIKKARPDKPVNRGAAAQGRAAEMAAERPGYYHKRGAA